MNRATFGRFAGRVVVTHFLTYFVAGLLFYLTGLNVLVYYERHPAPLLAALDKPSSSIWVMAGPLFQLARGFLFALALYPFRTVFLEARLGWLYLWGLLLAFAVFGTAGGAPGSIEGLVYTNLPFACHAVFLPEVLLQTLAFAWLLSFWNRGAPKWLTASLLVLFCLVLLMSTAGVVQALLRA